MARSIPKEEVRCLLETLPDEASYEDIQYHIYVQQKIDRGLEASGRGDFISMMKSNSGSHSGLGSKVDGPRVEGRRGTGPVSSRVIAAICRRFAARSPSCSEITSSVRETSSHRSRA